MRSPTFTPAPARYRALRPRAATPLRWTVAGLLCGLALALLFFAPAHWLITLLPPAAGYIQWVEPEGTVWDGSARIAITSPDATSPGVMLPGRLRWTLRPAWGHLRLTLSADCCTQAPVEVRFQPTLSGYALGVGSCSIRLPAAALVGLGTPWNTVEPRGQLTLACENLSARYADGLFSFEGRAVMGLRDFSSRLSAQQPLGSYQLVLAGGAAPTVQLGTLGGALVLDGEGDWAAGRLRFRGTARAATPEAQDVLSNLLNIIGKRQGPVSIISLG